MYRIFYRNTVTEKDIPALPPSIRKTVKRAIEERLTVDPVGLGKPLRYSLKGYRRLRVGDYRVIYSVEEAEKRVIVAAIGHRKDIYAD